MVSLTWTLALGIIVAFFLKKWLAYRQASAEINSHPGPRLLFGPGSFFVLFYFYGALYLYYRLILVS
jgi:hypothetical protein